MTDTLEADETETHVALIGAYEKEHLSLSEKAV